MQRVYRKRERRGRRRRRRSRSQLLLALLSRSSRDRRVNGPLLILSRFIPGRVAVITIAETLPTCVAASHEEEYGEEARIKRAKNAGRVQRWGEIRYSCSSFSSSSGETRRGKKTSGGRAALIGSLRHVARRSPTILSVSSNDYHSHDNRRFRFREEDFAKSVKTRSTVVSFISVFRVHFFFSNNLAPLVSKIQGKNFQVPYRSAGCIVDVKLESVTIAARR